MSAKSSKRVSSPLNQIFGAPDADDSKASFTTSAKRFVVDYYRPIAVLVAILLLLGAAYFIYQRINIQNMQLGVQMLNEAKDIAALDKPELVEKIQGTPLEFDWQVKRLELLLSKKKEGTTRLDIEAFLEAAGNFIDKYPRTGMAAEMCYISAIYRSYLSEFDKSIALFEKVINHPKAGFFKEMAEKELAALKDYKSDPDLDAKFKTSFEEFAKARLITPTPPPTPGQVPPPEVTPAPMPTTSDAPLPSAEPVDLNPTPAPTPAAPVETPAAPEELPEPEAPAGN